jgi:hypothetical protein
MEILSKFAQGKKISGKTLDDHVNSLNFIQFGILIFSCIDVCLFCLVQGCNKVHDNNKDKDFIWIALEGSEVPQNGKSSGGLSTIRKVPLMMILSLLDSLGWASNREQGRKTCKECGVIIEHGASIDL